MKIRVTRGYIAKYPLEVFYISKDIDCNVIPVAGMMFEDIGLVNADGQVETVEITKVTINPVENIYYVELKQDTDQVDKTVLEQKFKNMVVDDWEYNEYQF
ncbi:hypothetical protein IC800_18755 (plasmid) [Acinetobacter seifertii]|uniref:hypothetical protein n=1 Tax=Acinetobacter seifertii TaxID=1530123 RepID=UPI00168D8895|nr:hypothetical protein [Acinetobacter seifertii]QNW96585.1 hypothetical protein IC800_18755 [Acinetobacter seifertii]